MNAGRDDLVCSKGVSVNAMAPRFYVFDAVTCLNVSLLFAGGFTGRHPGFKGSSSPHWTVQDTDLRENPSN